MKRFLLLVTVLWVVPIVIAASLLHYRDPEREEVAAPPPPAFVRVGERTDDGRQPAELRLTWSTAQTILAPAAGIITSIDVEVGTVFESGAPVIGLDGQARLAYLGAVPFYRELSIGDAGLDVKELDHFLVESHLVEVTTLDSEGRFSASTQSAVRSMQAAAGNVRTDGVFRPADVVFVPPDFSTRAIQLALGQRVSEGEVLATSTQFVLSAELDLTADAGRQRLVSETAVHLSLPSGGQLEMEGSSFTTGELAELTSLVADSSLTSLQPVVVTRQVPLRVGAVPSTAILTEGSAVCILLGVSTSSLRAVVLNDDDVLGIEPGVTYVPSALIGDSVWSNPRGTEASCSL